MPSKQHLYKLLKEHKFYELHDELENHWKELPPGEEKTQTQGLIQLVVAAHHLQNNNYKGFEILLEKALAKLPLSEQSRTPSLAQLQVLTAEYLNKLIKTD